MKYHIYLIVLFVSVESIKCQMSIHCYCHSSMDTMSVSWPSLCPVVAVMVSLLVTRVRPSTWDYSHQCCSDPPHWPGLCHTGRHQSPISIGQAEISNEQLLNQLGIMS